MSVLKVWRSYKLPLQTCKPLRHLGSLVMSSVSGTPWPCARPQSTHQWRPTRCKHHRRAVHKDNNHKGLKWRVAKLPIVWICHGFPLQIFQVTSLQVGMCQISRHQPQYSLLRGSWLIGMCWYHKPSGWTDGSYVAFGARPFLKQILVILFVLHDPFMSKQDCARLDL